MRRPLLAGCLALAASIATTAPAAAAGQDDDDRKELPATYLEADERDDGTTDAATWMVGSGLAAIVLVGVGGTWMSRRQRRADPDGPPTT
jgi:hypothetical protein